MDSNDLIRKFRDVLRLRRCIDYYPAMSARDFAFRQYLDNRRYLARSAIIPVDFTEDYFSRMRENSS